MHHVAIFGAAGYTGVELTKLLVQHPGVRIAALASDHAVGASVEDLTGTLVGARYVSTEAALATEAAVACLAVKAETARAIVARLPAGVRVIDLSDAHRHSAVYGLTSLFAAEVAAAPLVANPGCYATAVITALAPLVRRGLVDRHVVVSAGSGVTGAGRVMTPALMFGEHYGDVRAYKVLRHQHVPEIEAALGRVAPNHEAPRIALTTHLLPVARGIFATITARLVGPTSTEELVAILRADYADDPTVDVAEAADRVSLRNVVGTNHCQLGVMSEGAAGGYVVVTAALDNLLKGAAGQAVENLNLMLGFQRMTGLQHLSRHA
jgi:N-acetyl-gamma-glutamyl-phosphate reductase